jgi:hypothetical protein
MQPAPAVSPISARRPRLPGGDLRLMKVGSRKFALDSALEGSGFELSVPLGRARASNRLSSVREHRDPMASPAAKASRLTEVPRQDKSGYG